MGPPRSPRPPPSPSPLTCAGCVLQAATLPERGQRLAFGRGCGPGGQVGGHVPGLSAVQLGEESWVSQSCGGRSAGELRSERGGEEGGGGGGEERCKHKCWELEGAAVRVRLGMCACVCTCVRVCYVPVSRDFQSGWFSAGLRSIPLQRNSPPTESRARAVAMTHTYTRVRTHAHAQTEQGTKTHCSGGQFCCCHDNHKWVGKPARREVVFTVVYGSTLLDILIVRSMTLH